MKRIFSFLARALVFALGASACVYFYLYTVGYFNAKPTVGHIPAPSGNCYLDIAALQSELEKKDIQLLQSKEGLSPAQAAEQLLAEGAGILLVEQDSASVPTDLLAAVRSAGAQVFFTGKAPGVSVLTGDGETWYLGSEAAQGGELLGKELALAFRDGTIADENSDHLLQYYVYDPAPTAYSQDITRYAIEECEHYGVYSNLLEYRDDEGELLSFNAESLADAQKPELILCATAADARTAYQVAGELGWLEGEAPTRIGTAAQSPEEAGELVNAGIALEAVYYDPYAIAQAAAEFAENLFERNFISLNTGLAPDQYGRFTLPYQLAG